ncbi:MAG: hypothetical protein AAF086_02175 [Planctomycetota bacterium]
MSKQNKLILHAGLMLVALVAVGMVVYSSTVHTPRSIMGTTPTPSSSILQPASLGPADAPVYDLEPQSLNELVQIPLAELHKVDIARMNLLCATKMIGGDHLTPDVVDSMLATIDSWLPRIRFETDRHMYRIHSTESEYVELFRGSEPRLRMYMLLQVLQEDLGVKYDMSADGNFSFVNSSVAFLHGIVPLEGKKLEDMPGGTCASMPVLYVAVGRRLGYPLKLVTTNAHVFVRWDGLASGGHVNPKWRERFNIEGTGEGVSFPDDDYYKTWPLPSTEWEIRANRYFVSLDAPSELAMFMAARGHVWYDNGAYGFAARAYENAHRSDPYRDLYKHWFGLAIGQFPEYKPITNTLFTITQQARARAERSKRTVHTAIGPRTVYANTASSSADLRRPGGGQVAQAGDGQPTRIYVPQTPIPYPRLSDPFRPAMPNFPQSPLPFGSTPGVPGHPGIGTQP